MKNANTRESLDRIRTTVLENLAQMPPAPSAQMAAVPPKVEKVGWRRAGGGLIAFPALHPACLPAFLSCCVFLLARNPCSAAGKLVQAEPPSQQPCSTALCRARLECVLVILIFVLFPPSSLPLLPPPQEELPEEEMEARGGGAAHDDRRVAREDDVSAEWLWWRAACVWQHRAFVHVHASCAVGWLSGAPDC